MYKVVYLPTARKQLEDAVMYIAVDLCAPDAATNLTDEVDEAVQKLKEMPYRFPIYHTLYAMKHEIRFFPVKNYNVYYSGPLVKTTLRKNFVNKAVCLVEP